MKQDEPDALDRALDAALAGYANEEPLAGLGDRVMQRVRAEGTVCRFDFRRWLAALAALAVAGWIAAIVVRTKPATRPAITTQAKSLAPPAVQISVTPAVLAKKHRRARRMIPRFTRDERALLALAVEKPSQAWEIFDFRRESPKPIQLEQIHIEPLRSEDAK